MSDKPILFNALMIRAILDGRKTQTRQIFMPPEPFDPDDDISVEIAACSIELPYTIGDRLWVREAWRSCVSLDALPPREIGERASEAGYKAPWGPVFYEADGTVAMWPDLAFTDTVGRIRPSIHMPRWASRLTLTVTDVRVQRVQEISERDAIAEGISLSPNRETYYRVVLPQPNYVDADAVDSRRAVTCFRHLWNSLHGPDAWDRNNWVIALTFDVHQCNIDTLAGEGVSDGF